METDQAWRRGDPYPADWPDWLRAADIEWCRVEVKAHGVVWHDGLWLGGEWLDGEWLDGEWDGGTWRRGLWLGGDWRGGEWHAGIWDGGTWLGGAWLGGSWRSGSWVDGLRIRNDGPPPRSPGSRAYRPKPAPIWRRGDAYPERWPEWLRAADIEWCSVVITELSRHVIWRDGKWRSGEWRGDAWLAGQWYDGEAWRTDGPPGSGGGR